MPRLSTEEKRKINRNRRKEYLNNNYYKKELIKILKQKNVIISSRMTKKEMINLILKLENTF